MENWKKFNEESLPEEEDFYCHLIMEDITEAGYALAKKVFKNFEMKIYNIMICMFKAIH